MNGRTILTRNSTAGKIIGFSPISNYIFQIDADGLRDDKGPNPLRGFRKREQKGVIPNEKKVLNNRTFFFLFYMYII